MLMPMIMSMQGIVNTHRGANLMFGAHQGQMALANSVTGNESMAQVQDIAWADKALALQSAYAQTLYFAGIAMQESAANMQKKEQELKKRLMDAGATFV